MSIYLKISRVGREENLKMAIKTAGSAQKIRVGRVSGNTAIFFRPDQSLVTLTLIDTLRWFCVKITSLTMSRNYLIKWHIVIHKEGGISNCMADLKIYQTCIFLIDHWSFYAR